MALILMWILESLRHERMSCPLTLDDLPITKAQMAGTTPLLPSKVAGHDLLDWRARSDNAQLRHAARLSFS
jgi:hypothetical protein